MGIWRRVARASFWKPSTIAYQSLTVLLAGEPPPPLRMEPIKYLVIFPGRMLFFSTCVICPIFSSSVICSNKAATRCSIGCEVSIGVTVLEALSVAAGSTVATGVTVACPQAESREEKIKAKARIRFIFGYLGPGRSDERQRTAAPLTTGPMVLGSACDLL